MDSKPQQAHLEPMLDPLLTLCRQAGKAIADYYLAPDAHHFESKEDDSPLTRADLASHAILVEGLAGLGVNLPVLSEESVPTAAAERRRWQRYWLVDPLDGTKEFLARTGEFTINVALIDDGKPVLGVLYQPLADVAHVGIPGLLSRRYKAAGPGWSVADSCTHRLARGDTLRVAVSRRHGGQRLQRTLDWLQANWGEVQRLNSGSALKFSSLAEGSSDFYPRFAPCCEWDTAAGQAVLEAAGGAVLGLDGAPLRYNCQDSLYSPHFFAIGDPGQALWRQLMALESRS